MHPQNVRILIDNVKLFSGEEKLYYEYNHNGKSVDMLHFIEDNLEFYSKAKEILKAEGLLS